MLDGLEERSDGLALGPGDVEGDADVDVEGDTDVDVEGDADGDADGLALGPGLLGLSVGDLVRAVHWPQLTRHLFSTSAPSEVVLQYLACLSLFLPIQAHPTNSPRFRVILKNGSSAQQM